MQMQAHEQLLQTTYMDSDDDSDELLQIILLQHSHELAAAKTLESDLDLAFQLQMQEALNTSVSDLVVDEIARFEREQSDREQAEAEMQRMRDDLGRRIHDQVEGSSSSSNGETLRLYFKGVQNTLSEELGVQTTLISEELEYQKAVEEEIQKLVSQGKRNEELGIEETLSEELQYQKAVEQEIQNLVWEQTRNEEGIGYGNLNNYGEEGVDNEDDGNGFVEGESEPMARWKEERYRRSLYPVRPDAEDCSFYMRTGACKLGSNCKFNHPFRKKKQFAKEKVKEREESPERPGQVECKYYLSSGGCKYGKACRYKHNIRKTPAVPIADFNFLSLPIRPGERECPFYMRNGSCKYGENCRFNHPDPTTVGGGDTLSGYGNGGAGPLQGASQSTMSPWSSPRASNDTGPFVPVVFPPTQGVPSPYPERNGYQWHGKDHVYPAPSERRLPTPPAFSLNTPAEINFYTPHKPPMLIDEFPERPGQPECSYFLKTGNCKYKSGCKFHHPKNRLPKTAAPFAPPVSHSGLPQRPGQNICSHYNRYGICKFGPGCKFDHPVNYGHSPLPAFVGPLVSSTFGNSPSVDDGWE